MVMVLELVLGKVMMIMMGSIGGIWLQLCLLVELIKVIVLEMLVLVAVVMVVVIVVVMRISDGANSKN